MLERLKIENYGCIKTLELALSPLHALIGPNDSGKSTTLRALRTMSLLAEANAATLSHSAEAKSLKSALFANAKSGRVLLAGESDGRTWQLQVLRGTLLSEKTFLGAIDDGNNSTKVLFEGGSQLMALSADASLAASFVGSQVLRLEPDVLRAPSGLIPDGEPLRLINERGAGLPGVYDAVLTRDLAAFVKINERLQELFPAVKTLSLKNTSSGEKALGVQLQDGTLVSAEFMSEGLLYYLAFAALVQLEKTAILLVEEPENGLHPARIADVMVALREISKTTQVIIATHSPLVINELRPDEVSVLTRTATEGTTGTLLKDTPNFDERSKVYALGELWLSYADGKDEAALLEGGSRP